MEGMATNTGIEYGHSVPIQLYPHTQALAAILLTDSNERFAHERGRDQCQQSRSLRQDEGSQSKSSVWVIPPACSALRDQGKQLQQQKRAKQRQAIALDESPSRFEVPDELQTHERNAFDSRNCQLIGGCPSTSQLSANSLRRERDGAVLVPLRMMASLVITSPTADGANEMSPGQQPTLFEEVVGLGTGEQQQQRKGVRQAVPTEALLLAEAPAGPSPVRGPPPSASGAAATQHGPRHRQQPSLPVTGVHRRANSLSAATGNFLSTELARQQPLGRMQEVQPQPKLHPASYQQEPEEEDDGTMLIDVGSADRSAEGALLPTPDRPRVAGAGSGWDALRGLGLSVLGGDNDGEIAGAGAAVRIADTLAMLSPFASTQQMESSGGLTAEVTVGQQQQKLRLNAVDLAGDEQARQGNQLPTLAQAELRPSQQRPLPTRTDEGTGHADGGFDADDEAETAQSTECARAALRLSGRHPGLRPLPGLSTVPPWATAPHAAHASGLVSFSSLAQALPVFLPTASSAELRRTASGIPGAAITRLEADPALSELLKLKCSLRRAVQSHNSHAGGLILSLLGALPVTPELLAASQVATVVEPLQQSSCTQVANAARHAVAVWKAVLKAAARRPASAGGYPAVQNVAGEAVDGGSGGNAGAYAYGAGTSHQYHSSHRLQRGSSLPHAGFHSPVHGDPHGMDVSMRDQIDPLSRPLASARDGRQQPIGRHIPALSHARSKSNMLADGLLAACHLAEHIGPSATQPRSPHADVQGTRLDSREGLPACDGVAWITDSRGRDMQLGKQGKGGRDSGRSRGGRGSSPSESRTVTEGETGGRSSDEDTSEEGYAAPPAGTVTGNGGRPCGEQGQRSGGVSGSYSGATLSCLPLPAPTAAAVTNGGGRGLTYAMPSAFQSPDTRTVFASHAAWPPMAAASWQPHPLQNKTFLGGAPQSNTAVASQALRVLEPCVDMCSPPGCGGGSGALLPVQSPLRHLSAAATGFPPAHEVGMSEVLSLAIPPLTPAVAAGAPPGSLLLSPPGLPQHPSRKRKVDRSSSRRRSFNPSKRIASPAGPGLFQGLRTGLPASQSGDAGGGVSDDQRHLHGPVAGVKTPSRTSLLALHAPLSKRQRHHASGAGAHGAGGGQSTATQVRRMSVLLNSLDLGHGGVVQASAEPEGDADADADMGSQDDGAAMLTSDDDAMPTAAPCTNNGAATASPDTEAGDGAGVGVLANGHAAMGFQNGNGNIMNSMMHALARQRHVSFGAQGDGAGLVRTEEVGDSEEEVLLISTGLVQEVQGETGGIVIEQVSPAGYAETRRSQLVYPSLVPEAALRLDKSSGKYPFVADAGDAGTYTGS